jgi:murein L,D-transpeptidase YcbB/YkuD
MDTLGMRRLDKRKTVLAGVAFAALFAAWGGTPVVAAQQDRAVEDRIPVPEPVNVPPPGLSEVKQTATPGDVDLLVPMPEVIDVPQITREEVMGKPVIVENPVADKLRELLAARTDRIFDRKKERDGALAFYTARGFAPLWSDSAALNERGKAAIAYLKQVDTEGLDPADYPTPQFRADADPAALAEAELKLTNAVLTFARHAQNGRVHWSRLAADIFYNQVVPEPADILAKLAGDDAGRVLASFNPQHEGYKALKAKLAEARNKSGEATAPARIPGGRQVKVGMEDSRVPLLRERFGVPAADKDVYDKPLAEAVKKFQSQRKLAASGVLNNPTIDAINGPRRDRDADTILANMERWRWLPRDLGKTYVMVNIPDYTLKVVSNGHMVWTTKIVVGKPGNLATPMLTETMKFITVNPTWNVPPSIIQNEYMPALREDPQAMERIGLKVTTNPDGTIHIYQPPGDRNALGRIRFNFPNKFLVYQHDTPDKHLFAQDKRAYSHGCMRVENPLRYAEVLLGLVLPKEGYTQERLKRMFGTAEQDIQFPEAMRPWVHLTYQTAFVDDAGKLQIRDDVYGRDQRLLAILKGDERRMADVAIERPRNPSGVSREALRMPDRYGYGPNQNPFRGFFGLFR